MDILDITMLAVVIGILLVCIWYLMPKRKSPINEFKQQLLDEIINAKLKIKNTRHYKTADRTSKIEEVYKNLGETIVEYGDGSVKVFSGLKWLVHGEHTLQMKKVNVKRRYPSVI